MIIEAQDYNVRLDPNFDLLLCSQNHARVAALRRVLFRDGDTFKILRSLRGTRGSILIYKAIANRANRAMKGVVYARHAWSFKL